MKNSSPASKEPDSEEVSREQKRKAAEILPSMYDELRQLAARKMASESPGHTLYATALVHESYLRIAKTEEDMRWDNRGHFYMAVAEAMWRILIDRARRKKAIRHGGEWQRTESNSINAPTVAPDKSDELLALDEALREFSKLDERKGRLVKLRYSVGLSGARAAEVLGISKATADRDWVWLHDRVRSDREP